MKCTIRQKYLIGQQRNAVHTSNAGQKEVMFINQGQSPLDQRALQPWIFPGERGLTRDHRDISVWTWGFSCGSHTSTGWGAHHGHGQAGRGTLKCPFKWQEPVTVTYGPYSQSKGNDGNRASAVTVRAALSRPGGMSQYFLPGSKVLTDTVSQAFKWSGCRQSSLSGWGLLHSGPGSYRASSRDVCSSEC